MKKEDNMTKCLFCGKPVNSLKIREGGRISFCDACMKRLEEKGYLNIQNRVVNLNKPLMEVILGYASA
ncbi:MAG: hypothetical protein ACXQT5_01540 [Candidatus Syntropharchaeia archaeon]